MKKLFALCMSFCLAAGVLCGCSGEPGKAETMERLESICGGENIEIEDHLVRSLDRDLEFSYWYDWKGESIWPDIGIKLGGKYILDSTYMVDVHGYWYEEYRKAVASYGFDYVYYEETEYRSPDQAYVYVEDSASPEEVMKVESLLFDLREICREEEKFHSSKCAEDFAYYVSIWYIDNEAGTYTKTAPVIIKADTRDDELKVADLELMGDEPADPRNKDLTDGSAKIFVR